SLQTVHQETKVSLAYLEALESGNWKAFPAEVYCTGFLRKYSSYLGLNPEEMVGLYRKEQDSLLSEEKEKESREIHLETKQRSTMRFQSLLLVFLIAVLASWWFYTVVRTPKEEKKPPQITRITDLKKRPKVPAILDT